MKRNIGIAAVLFLTLITPFPVHAGETCTPQNSPTLADDNLTVTVSSMNILEKTGSFQLTIAYRLLNGTTDKKIDEGSFKIFFTDGTSEPQYGSFGTFFPSDFRDRSYTWEYLKSKTPMAVSYNAGFFATDVSSGKLNWSPPGQSCSSIYGAIMAAAEKASVAAKIAADKAAADKTALDKIAAENLRFSQNNTASVEVTDSANAATDAANFVAEANDVVTSTYLELYDSAIQKAQSSGTKTIIDVIKVTKNTEDQIAVFSLRIKFAESKSVLLLKTTTDITLAPETINIYKKALNNWSSALSNYNKGVGRLEALKLQIKNSQFTINAAADKFVIEKASAAKPKVSVKTTITCIKGKFAKKVSAVNPKCPAGYKVKK
jgi:hypothetical protein